MTLLALETATTTCGVAVMSDDTIVGETHLFRPRVHSERLTPLVEDTLRHTDVSATSLDAVAVSQGPGSYTGLRIGVSTAKGWALSVDADLVGVPTLEAYAAQLQPVARANDVVCALLHARRDEVYAASYRVTAEGLVEHAPTTALSAETLPEWIGAVEEHLWLVGDGAEMMDEALTGLEVPRTCLSPDAVRPSASWVARRGQARLADRGPDDLDSLEPLYVKDVHATPAPSPFA